jgi:hypothetical protein
VIQGFSFVGFITNVGQNVSPGYPVGTPNNPWASNIPKCFTDIYLVLAKKMSEGKNPRCMQDIGRKRRRWCGDDWHRLGSGLSYLPCLPGLLQSLLLLFGVDCSGAGEEVEHQPRTYWLSTMQGMYCMLCALLIAGQRFYEKYSMQFYLLI